MEYEYFGYPADYLEKFKANIEKVTAADILRAARERVHPDKLVVLAVGRDQDFDKPLAELGQPNLIDITIPQPKVVVAAADPASLQRGHAVLENMVNAMGGAERIRGLKDMTIEATAVFKTPQGELKVTSTSYLVLPNKIRQEATLPFGQLITVFDGTRSWMKTPQGVRDMPETQQNEMVQQNTRNSLVALQDALASKRTVSFLESAEVDGKPADVVQFSDAAGNVFRMYADAVTGRPVKKAYKGSSPMVGPVDVEELYSDYHDVEGYSLPFKIVLIQNGRTFAEIDISSYQLNKAPDPKLFVREETKETK